MRGASPRNRSLVEILNGSKNSEILSAYELAAQEGLSTSAGQIQV